MACLHVIADESRSMRLMSNGEVKASYIVSDIDSIIFVRTTVYHLTFDTNGGEGEMPAQTLEAGVSQALAANTFTRDGYVFTGWNTNADGSGNSYTNKQSITLTQDITLYAQWEVIATPGYENGYEWVDLGLPSGLKWATCNVGATTPQGYGDYFAWGETSPKSNYTWETYKFRTSGDNDDNVKFNKYNTSSNHGTVDNKTTLDLSDDAARANWGGKWRMPTEAEQEELRNNCTWTWTLQKGVNGYKVTSKTNGNSIFLPAAGGCDGTSVYRVGSYGYYWSSSLDESDPSDAYCLDFSSRTVDWGYDSGRNDGHPVRAVCYTEFPIVTFDTNGGEGEMPAQKIAKGELSALATNTFTRSGYTFIGWNTSPDGSGTAYTDGQVITLMQDITLYAQWQVVSGTENGYAYVDLGLPSGAKW
ncbi:MAG: InlB B-repeat-containing protein, partial [Bacteroidales bacterium]|nr:InlB B-repeat-containing protein [Bacteroidales bacterium]